MEILLVAADTRSTEAELFDRLLTEKCVGVETVHSYARAIESLARHRHRIVVLAHIDGHGELRTAEAIRIMKEIVPDVLIIAVSEELPIEDERELREAGLYYYLTRPLDES